MQDKNTQSLDRRKLISSLLLGGLCLPMAAHTKTESSQHENNAELEHINPTPCVIRQVSDVRCKMSCDIFFFYFSALSKRWSQLREGLPRLVSQDMATTAINFCK